MHVQSCCFGYNTYCFFNVLVAVAVALLKLPIALYVPSPKAVNGVMNRENKSTACYYTVKDNGL